MSAKVQQLCSNIAKHPSKINLLNEVLTLILAKPNCRDLGVVVELMMKMVEKEECAVFLSKKIRAIFMTLLEISSFEDEEDKMSLLKKCYDMSREKSVLISYFQEWAFKNGT